MTGSESALRHPQIPGPGEPWTPIRLTRWSGDYLEGKGLEKGRLDAELLLAHVLNVRRLDLYLQFDRPLGSLELEAFKALLRRRAAREPLQYVLGKTAFRELELRTDSRALIPRPETEVLVEEVLLWGRRQQGGLTALDVGTGSGAIALSLLREGPFRTVVATDSSSSALALARENAESLKLMDGIEFREGHLTETVRVGERFDVMVSNPPYIAERDRDSLQPEIRDWEPSEALFGGPDGLEVLLLLVESGPGVLRPGGLLALEVGEGQGPRVAEAMEQTHAFGSVTIRRDLSGRERVVLGVASP